MKKRVGHKIGDTLIEVLFATGVFSVIAVSVVAIMNNGTKNIQTSLETTMTRNEIDSQTEALRFIQASYIAEKNSGNKSIYHDLWKEITKLANTLVNDETKDQAITTYSPRSCDALYENDQWSTLYSQNAFVINTHKLGTDEASTAVEKARKDGMLNSVFESTAIYPRILYGTNEESLVDANKSRNITNVQGIYVVGVRDPGSTAVNADGVTTSGVYYDFYVRTCWYGAGAKHASTISTVIRLYDPDMLEL